MTSGKYAKNQKKVVAIIGASGGMGEATARYLAARGCKVMLGARSIDKLSQIVDEIRWDGGEAEFFGVDATRRDDVDAFVRHAVITFGRVDVFVASAEAMPIGPMDELATADWELMVDVNIKGLLWGIAASLPVFRKQHSGHFVAIASTAARKIVPNMAVYGGTKAAVIAICEGLRQEAAGELRVTTLLPGFTTTNFAEYICDDRLRAQLGTGATIAVPAEAVAAAIAYAIDQPNSVDVGEILIRPTTLALADKFLSPPIRSSP
jgi:NADP-dependent 3-hydroxy acid dehydrogenase YdfG